MGWTPCCCNGLPASMFQQGWLSPLAHMQCRWNPTARPQSVDISITPNRLLHSTLAAQVRLRLPSVCASA